MELAVLPIFSVVDEMGALVAVVSGLPAVDCVRLSVVEELEDPVL